MSAALDTSQTELIATVQVFVADVVYAPNDWQPEIELPAIRKQPGQRYSIPEVRKDKKL